MCIRDSQISISYVFQRLRLTLGDMYFFNTQIRSPKTIKNGPASGPGGSVWAQTLSERRPEAQDHFPSPPGPKSPIKKNKKLENVENLVVYRSKACQSASRSYAKPGFRTRPGSGLQSGAMCGSSPKILTTVWAVCLSPESRPDQARTPSWSLPLTPLSYCRFRGSFGRVCGHSRILWHNWPH